MSVKALQALYILGKRVLYLIVPITLRAGLVIYVTTMGFMILFQLSDNATDYHHRQHHPHQSVVHVIFVPSMVTQLTRMLPFRAVTHVKMYGAIPIPQFLQEQSNVHLQRITLAAFAVMESLPAIFVVTNP